MRSAKCEMGVAIATANVDVMPSCIRLPPSLYLLSPPPQPPPPLLSSALSETRPAMSEWQLCSAMSEWRLSLASASFPSLADYPSLKLTGTAVEGEHETPQQTLQHQFEVEARRNQSENLEVLKATSGNAAKRLKNRQETRVATRASKNAEAAIKQIATQELQVEKKKIQEWKKNAMQVAQELHAIKLAQDEVMEAERQSFQIELERVREKLEQVETKSKSLEDEIRALKAKDKTLERHPSPSISPAPDTR